jgi:hypothetical protein
MVFWTVFVIMCLCICCYCLSSSSLYMYGNSEVEASGTSPPVLTGEAGTAAGAAASGGAPGGTAAGGASGSGTQRPSTSNMNLIPSPSPTTPPQLPAIKKLITPGELPSAVTTGQVAQLQAALATPPPPPADTGSYTGNAWKSGQTINIGDTIRTSDGTVSASVIASGDFQVVQNGNVVYSAFTNDSARATVATRLPGWTPTGIAFSSDNGSFAINGTWMGMSRDGWSTPSQPVSNGPYQMVVQTDGRCYIYDSTKTVVWKT